MSFVGLFQVIPVRHNPLSVLRSWWLDSLGKAKQDGVEGSENDQTR